MSHLSVAEERTPPLVALAFAVVAVSTSAILIEWSRAPSLVKAFYRVVFTVVMLLPIALGRAKDRVAFRRLRLRDVLVAVVSGIALAIHFASWFESLQWTSVAASATLVQAQPLFVVAGAWALLDERVTGKMLLGIGIALAGMLVMSVGDVVLGTATLTGERSLYGNALAVVGAVTVAGYVLAGRSLRQRLPLLPYVLVVYISCALALLLATVASDYPLLGYPPREWLLFLGMALGPGLIGHTVINWALGHVESSVVSVSLLGEPIVSTVLAVVLLAQYPSFVTLVGGAVVLAGVYLTVSDRASHA